MDVSKITPLDINQNGNLETFSLAENNGSCILKIRGKCFPSNKYRADSISLKRYDLHMSDNISPWQAAREGRLEVLKNLKDKDQKCLEQRDKAGYTPLHYASRANKLEAILFLLDSGVETNVKGGAEGLTPLHLSVRFQSLEATEILVSYGADTSIKSANGNTPLHFAARHGDKVVCQLLLEDRLLDMKVPDNSGATAFHFACASGNLELCEFLLDHGADIFAVTDEGRNSLHIAALHGNSEVVGMLLPADQLSNEEIEAFIGKEDFEKNTALHLACKKGHLPTVKVLLEHNADLDSRNDIVSNTPLHVATQTGQVDIVKVLIENGADVKTINTLQRMPIHLASLFGHWEVIQCLLHNGSPIDPQDGSSLTPLLTAVSAGRLLVAERLIQLGADTGLRNESLQTCIHIAVKNKRMDMLELLVNTIGNEILDVGDDKFRVPLHYCAYAEEFEMLHFILSRTANLHPKDIFDKIPLHIAAEIGNIACVKALAEASPLHVSDRDNSNITPLHEAARNGNQHVCKYLLRLGVDATSKDSNRWTALHHAASSGYTETVDVLLKAKMVCSSQTIGEQDSDGNTPLILAARNGHVDVVRLLIDQDADITIRNKQRMTCLDNAVEHDKVMVVMEIVKSKRWYDVVSHRPHEHKYPMKTLIEKMPQAAKAVLDRCIKYSNLPHDDPEFSIECDFRLLDSRLKIQTLGTDGKEDFKTRFNDWEEENVQEKNTESGKDEKLKKHRTSHKEDKPQKRRNVGEKEVKKTSSHFFGPATMVRNKRKALLTHPLVEIFLLHSWRSFGRHAFNLTFCIYIAYVFVFTYCVIKKRMKSVVVHGQIYSYTHGHVFMTGFIIALTLVYIIKEFLQMISQGISYFKTVCNYFEFAAYITTLVCMVLNLENHQIQPLYLLPLEASAILLLYANLILFMRYVGFWGIYIMMFMEILKTMARVMLIFFLFIFSYGLTLFILLKHQPAFDSIGWSFVKTIFMAIDGINFDDIINPQEPSPHPVFTTAVLIFFGFLMNILLMNLLVGLAVGDIDTIQKNASFNKKAMIVEYILETEQRYNFRWIRRITGLLMPTMTFKLNTMQTWLHAQFYSNEGVNIFLKTKANEEDSVANQTQELQKVIEKQVHLMSIVKHWQADVGDSSYSGHVKVAKRDTTAKVSNI